MHTYTKRLIALKFQSTPSVGRATTATVRIDRLRFISIHALRGEGDARSLCAAKTSAHFNPRPPWGGRPRSSSATWGEAGISIHALRGEGDLQTKKRALRTVYFNPRPLWGGRPDEQHGRQ